MTLYLGLKYLTIFEDGRCAFDANNAREAVLPGHDGPVRDESAELRCNSSQKWKVRAPTDVRAHRDQNVPLEKTFRAVLITTKNIEEVC